MKTLVFVGCNAGGDVVNLALQHDRSILFEPLPSAANELRKMVAGISNAEVLNLACGESESTATLNVYNDRGLSSSLGTVTQQAIDHFPRADLTLSAQVQVRVVNLMDFLRERNIREIESLVIDAQGMDLTILKTLEPLLETRSINSIRTEADGDGFQHYDGLPDNSVESHFEFMARFPEYSRIPTRTVHWHPDLKWELQRDCSFTERVERLSCRSYV